MKHCNTCLLPKALAEFDRRRAHEDDGHSNKCKACCAAYRAENACRYARLRRASYERNCEAEKAAALKYYFDNRDARMRKHAEYMRRNAERMAEYRRQTVQDYNARTAKRRAALLQRTPGWLTAEDYRAMHAFYVLAKRYEKATGVKFHVDHVFPLQGKFVSGLHVPTNLRVLAAQVNLSKGSRFDPAAATS